MPKETVAKAIQNLPPVGSGGSLVVRSSASFVFDLLYADVSTTLSKVFISVLSILILDT
jgi:hypothetical protein